MDQKARRNGVDGPAVQRAGPRPRRAVLARGLDVHEPRPVLRTGAAQQATVVQQQRLVLDGPDHAVGQADRRRPGLAAIARSPALAPPPRAVRPDFVEQDQRSVFRRMQHRIPAGIAQRLALHAVRHLDGRRPAPLFLARRPDPDVLVAFARAAEPRRHEAARHLRHGRRVARRRRHRVVHKLSRFDRAAGFDRNGPPRERQNRSCTCTSDFHVIPFHGPTRRDG